MCSVGETATTGQYLSKRLGKPEGHYKDHDGTHAYKNDGPGAISLVRSSDGGAYDAKNEAALETQKVGSVARQQAAPTASRTLLGKSVRGKTGKAVASGTKQQKKTLLGG